MEKLKLSLGKLKLSMENLVLLVLQLRMEAHQLHMGNQKLDLEKPVVLDLEKLRLGMVVNLVMEKFLVQWTNLSMSLTTGTKIVHLHRHH